MYNHRPCSTCASERAPWVGVCHYSQPARRGALRKFRPLLKPVIVTPWHHLVVPDVMAIGARTHGVLAILARQQRSDASRKSAHQLRGLMGHVELVTRCGSHEQPPHPSRRLAAATLACAMLGLSTQQAGRAENGPIPKTCAGEEITEAEPPGVVPYTDPAGRFRLVRPCGWTRVTTLLPGSSVLASFYNPEEPGAETLAVYQAPAPVQETRQLGSAQDVAAGLANVAPHGVLVEAKSLRHADREYLLAHVQFGGNTAGMFGAAREFRVITIAGDVQYTLRVTTTRYRYLAFSQVQELLQRVAESFEVIPMLDRQIQTD